MARRALLLGPDLGTKGAENERDSKSRQRSDKCWRHKGILCVPCTALCDVLCGLWRLEKCYVVTLEIGECDSIILLFAHGAEDYSAFCL